MIDVNDIQTVSEHHKLNQQVLEEIDKIRILFTQKNNQYRTSPVVTLPTASWLHQIRIKSERALQAIDNEKRIDELKDCAVYCLLTIAKERIENENIGEQ